MVPIFKKNLWSLWLFAIILFLSPVVQAQVLSTENILPEANVEVNIETLQNLEARSKSIASAIVKDDITAEKLDGFESDLDAIINETNNLKNKLTASIEELNSFIEATQPEEIAPTATQEEGTPPSQDVIASQNGNAETQPASSESTQKNLNENKEEPNTDQLDNDAQDNISETDNVVQEDPKQDIETFKAEVEKRQALLSRINGLVVANAKLKSQIRSLRLEILKRELLNKNTELFQLDNWKKVGKNQEVLFTSISRVLTSFIKRLSTIGYYGLSILCLSIFIAWGIGHYIQKFLKKWRVGQIENNSKLDQSGGAKRALLLPFNLMIKPLLIVMALSIVLKELGHLPVFIASMIQLTGVLVIFLGIGHGILSALLAPNHNHLRQANVNDVQAKWLYYVSYIIMITLAVSYSLRRLSEIFVLDYIYIQAISIIFGFIMHALIILMIWRYIRNKDNEEESLFQTSQPSFMPYLGNVWPLSLLISLIGLIASLLGYASLSYFLAVQLIWVHFVALAIRFLQILIADGLEWQMTSPLGFGRYISRELSVKPRFLRQVGMVIAAIIRILLIILGIRLALISLATGGSLLSLIPDRLTNLQFDMSSLKIDDILIGLSILLVGIGFTRIARRWLADRYLPETQLSESVQNSITVGFGYAGFILSSMVAFSSAGLNLENIAIIAGALSVGIGFGLQAIVSNFISGIILLAERPVAVGDWIAVDGHEGYVRKISVRATEIQTFDRSTVIVPNSNLITSSVINHMHENMMGRMVLPVGVSYDSDVDLVTDLLVNAAKGHSKTLSDPEPFVIFKSFGDSSLDFLLYAYFSDVNEVVKAKSDIHYSILQAFRENDIEIPFPQSDIRVYPTNAKESKKSDSFPPAEEEDGASKA